MYSENLRSFLRTVGRKVISDWTGEKEPGPITRHVLDVILVDHEFTRDDMFEGLYRVAYDEICNLLKGTAQTTIKPDLKQLLLWRVPETQAKIIIQIDRQAVYVPSVKAYKQLYGKDRIKLKEIPESVAHYKTEARANERIAILLDELFNSPGNYYK